MLNTINKQLRTNVFFHRFIFVNNFRITNSNRQVYLFHFFDCFVLKFVNKNKK